MKKITLKKKETSKRLHGTPNYRNGEQARKTFLENHTQEEIEELYKNSIKTRDNVSNKVKEERINKARKTRENKNHKWVSDETIKKIKETKKINLYYKWNGKLKSYYVDFIVDGQYVEIKNDLLYERLLIPNTKDNEKYKLMIKNNVIILKYKEILPFLKYINEKYGKNYLKQFIDSNVKL